MRSAILSLVVGLGVLGFSLTTPAQAKADEHLGPAFTNNSDTQLVHWRGGWGGYYGRPYYGGYGGYGRAYGGYGRSYGGYGLYGGYGGYGGYNSYYYPRYYGGYSPWGYGYGVRPYSSFYYRPGFFW